MKAWHKGNPTLQFTLPVILENLLFVLAGLVFSYLIGGISGSALTTIAMGNQVITLITAAATMLVTGSGILCARLLGAQENREASNIAEQTMLLALASGVIITALCEIFASPLMSLLMPNAEAAVLQEGIAFFRVLILSLPCALLISALGSILRSSGDGRSPMAVTVLCSALQLLFAFVFLRILNLNVIGAGLCYLLCRIGGATLAVIIVLRSHRYSVRIRNIFRPDFAAFRRILAVGIPTSIESIFVQLGYLIGNSMVIGLGTFEASVYNVANTLYTFASLPQSICTAVATPLIGQLIGAKALKQAKKTGWKIWAIGMGFSLVISTAIALLGQRLTGLYTADARVQQQAALVLWDVFFMCIPAISLNALDPQLRVGGDVKFVMVVTVIAVWAIKLPMTYLLCYVWNLGASGVVWANTISLVFRMILNMRRFIQGKYLTMRV